MNELRLALYYDETPSRREIRAARTRAQALAPGRILMSLLTLPVVAVVVATSIYIRTSEYDPPDALAHLVARVGCNAAQSIGLAPAYRGELGYHAKNDANGDGVSCEAADFAAMSASGPVSGVASGAASGLVAESVQDVVYNNPVTRPVGPARTVGGAKFVKP